MRKTHLHLTRKLIRASVVLLVLSSVAVALPKNNVNAQGPSTCAQLLPKVQQNLAASCQGMDRDQICLGYPSVTVQYQNTNGAPPFQKVGDIVPISAIKSISTAPLNLERNEWGLAVFKIQANLPNTSAGQAVTFVLYGDTKLSNPAAPAATTKPDSVSCAGTTTRATSITAKPGSAPQNLKPLTPNTDIKVAGRLADQSWVLVTSGDTTGWLFAKNVNLACDMGKLPVVDPAAPAVLANMGAFYFSTGVSAQAECKDAPSGVMIQSPTGSTVKFKINGVSMTIGSTVVLRAQPKGKMKVAVLKGKAILNVGGKEEIITNGEESSIPLGGDDGLSADGPPEPPQEITDPTLDTNTACSVVDSVDSGNLCASEPESSDQSQGSGTTGTGEENPSGDQSGDQSNGQSNSQSSGQPSGQSNGDSSGGSMGTDQSGNGGSDSGQDNTGGSGETNPNGDKGDNGGNSGSGNDSGGGSSDGSQ